jgi:outer membrane lipoprotein-sorting protein
LRSNRSNSLLLFLVIPVLAVGAFSPLVASPSQQAGKTTLDLKEVLAHMEATGKHLRDVSTELEYTKVTVLVDDKSTEYGKLYFRNTRNPEILLNFEKPDPKIILFKKNKAEIYIPKTNQIQEYNLEEHSGLIQQFLLLGFGSDSDDLKKAYEVKLVGEEAVGGASAVILELTPRDDRVANQLAKVQLWISKESWLPLQQKFFETSGDYLLTRYTALKVNRSLPTSTFQLAAPKDAKRIKMQ